MKIMASGPITLWQIDRETVETVSDFMFWGSKITADGDCSHEVKRPYSLEGVILKLELQYFCYLIQRADSLVKTLVLGKIEGRRRRR